MLFRSVSGRGSYEEETAAVGKVGSAMKRRTFLIGGFETGASEESLRLAYFSGRLDLIGWQPSSKREADAVTAAGGAAEWNSEISSKEAAARQQRARAAQSPHDNLLGIGLLFQKQGDLTLGVRYARVLARTDALARGQVYAEGQVVGAPVSDPRRLGGSFGLGIEYQEPWFYGAAGVRLVGSGAVGGGSDARVDVAPFLGFGVRAWQGVRVGAEATVLLPLTNDRPTLSGGGTLAIEF